MSRTDVHFTSQVGSSTGGQPFEYYRGTDGVVVMSVTVWAAATYIKAIKLTFTDGSTKQYGMDSSRAREGDVRSKSFTFNSGERITNLSFWENDAGTRVGYIRFTTNQNREFSHGVENHGTVEHKQEVSSGILVGLFGRAKLDVQALGVVFIGGPQTTLALYNVSYQLDDRFVTISRLENQSKSIFTLQYINQANQKLQVDVSDAEGAVSFSGEYSKWSVDNLASIAPYFDPFSRQVTVEARIPVLTLDGSRARMTTSSSSYTFRGFSTEKSTSSNHPWRGSFSLVPGQTCVVSSQAYSGFTRGVSGLTTFTGNCDVTTTVAMVPGIPVTHNVSGTYEGQTYIYGPIISLT